MSDTKLKPCPFCGGEAKLRKLNKDRGYFVLCSKCGCRTPYFRYRYAPIDDLREDAIDTWNTRKPIDRIVEKLEEEIEKASEEYWTDYDERQITISTLYGAIDIVKAGGIDG